MAIFNKAWHKGVTFFSDIEGQTSTSPNAFPSQSSLNHRRQRKCIVDLRGNSQLSLKARNSCIDSQWFKNDLLACNLRLDLSDLLIQPVSLGNQQSINVWRQIRIPYTTWRVYTSTRGSQHTYGLLPRRLDREGILGCWRGYVNFTWVIFRGSY